MKRLIGLSAFGLLLGTSTAAIAQTPPKPAQQTSDTRPATPTVAGDTGLWLVPTAEVLAHKKWSLSFNQVNFDDGQGFSDVNRCPVTFGVGIGHFVEVFGSWNTVVRVDRDTRPLFFTSTSAEATTGTGGGIVADYPMGKSGWSGNKVGDAWVGGKVNLLAMSRAPVAVGVRAQVKIPTGDDSISSGKVDFQIDGIVSTQQTRFQASGFVGYLTRGDPS